ncbi:hypothetical protein AcV7_006858 [Taiwanofungus camphoratus]|nr:hypothetical protein AcV7_006858 [Antrodia cinnamomea]
MSSKVVAVILAKENCAVHLKLTYLVKEASWQPYYDLYATTTNGRYSSSVSLHYRAHIIQSTGEDWKDAKLTLSTSTAQATPNVNIPDLKPLKIKVRQNVPLGLAGAAQLQARKHVFGKPSFPAVSAFKPQWQPPYQKFGFADRSTSFLASFSSSSVDDASSNSTIACTGSSSGQVSSPIASTPSKSVCISKPNVDVASPGGGFFGAATDQAQPRTISTPFAPVIVGNTNLWLPVGGRWASLVDQSKQTSQPILAEFKVQDTEVSSVKHVKAEPLQTSPAILDSVAQKTAATDVHFLTKGKARLTIPGKDEARETSLFSGLQTTATPQRTDQPAAAYRIEGTTSIASDGAAHAVSLALLTLDAQVARVCVPRVHQGTFIECTVCNTSEYQMLPGPLSVYANDNYVSDTSVEEIRPNESFVCTLGVDAALHTTQIRTSTTKQDPQPPFSEWRKTTACTARTTIINRGTSAVSMLIVRDVFPLADDDQVQITIRKPMGLMEAEGGQELDIANDEQKVGEGEETREVNESLRVLERKVRWAKDIDEKRGKEEGRYEWLCGLEAKETVVLVAEWEIKTPYHVWWDEVSQ